MCKLYFRYGTMNSSKTANLLMVAHNYISQGKRVILMKPSIDTRFSESKIVSRAVGGMEADVILFPETNSFDLDLKNVYCILVDEAQFLSDTNVEALRKLTDKIPVLCYGLRTDYRVKLFPGAKRLMELADMIEEIKTVCVHCDRKAIINAKFQQCGTNRTIIKDGSSVPELGAEEKYQPMCWKCWC